MTDYLIKRVFGVRAAFVCLAVGAALALGGQWWWHQRQQTLAVAEAEAERAALENALAAEQTRNERLLARTALTLLEVEPDGVSLLIARADGSHERVETPFAPEREIYVDYVVTQGRVLIRRVFDDRTAPREGVVVDPQLVAVDWEALDPRSHGRAVYRRLSEGRWMVTLNGAGALGLEPAPADVVPALTELKHSLN